MPMTLIPKTRLVAVIGLALLASLPLSAVPDQPIRTENGPVTGVAGRHPEVRVFKGIPFAAPPLGELRWKPPQPAASWQGTRAADAFSANCMQRSANGGAFPPYGGDRSAVRMSEDCLYLNVYTTARPSDDRRPVMVWVHGGALTSGAGAIYEGEELALKGVVVVTVNYRLGVFGFLAHPELTTESDHQASGNYGLLDQVAALKWVHNNIAAFGGDPTRVTIFGESAGSWSVNYLMASPLAHGLFQRVIGESGGQFGLGRALAEAEQAGLKFGQAVRASSLALLRTMSADDLVKANGFQTTGTVDGWFLPEDVNTIFAKGRQNDVPLLIGSNADEGSIFTPATVTSASFREQSERRFGQDATTLAAFSKLYPSSSDEEARASQAASMRDQTFGWEMRTWARAQTRTGKSKVYLYYFSRIPPIPDRERARSQHGAEIPYAFNWVHGGLSTTPWESVDRKLADDVSGYWVNFATTGNPNGRNLPKWPTYQMKDDVALHLGDTVVPAPLPHKAALDFLDGYMERLRHAPTRSQ
jgi:para-nitrobenzyl esterase